MNMVSQFVTRVIFFSAIALCLHVASASGESTPSIFEAYVLLDPSGALSIAEVIDADALNRFTPITLPTFLGKDDSVYWLRFRIGFPSGTEETAWTLDLNWDYLRSLDLYIPNISENSIFGSGDWNVYVDSSMDIPQSKFSDLVCYVRLVGYGGLNVNPMIIATAAAQKADVARTWLLGLFFGLLGAMFIYNLLLYVSLKDQSYLWYVLHVLLLGWYCLFFNGLAPSIPGGGPEEIFQRNVRFILQTTSMMFLCIGMFTRSFLLTEKYAPSLDKLLRVQVILCGAVFLASFFVPASQVTGFGPVLGISTSIIVLICAIHRLAAGYKPARFFLPGWIVYIACGFSHSLAWAGVLPPNVFTVYAPEIGSSFEVMIMSLALAYRVKLLREEKAAAEKENALLAEKTALFTILLDNSKLGIALVKQGVFSWSNKQLQRIIGVERQLQGVRLAELSGFNALLHDSGPGAPPDTLVRDGQIVVQGRVKHVRALGQRVHESDLEPGTVWVVEDVSEQKRLEQFKEEIDQIVHHDLKSPFATISSLQEAIESIGPLTMQQKKCCSMIGEVANRGMQQLNVALTLYKIESGNSNLELSRINLCRSIEKAIEELTPYLCNNMRSVHFSVEPDQRATCIVHGDELLVHIVFVNLVKNALEAIPGGGEVDVLIEDRDDLCVRITNPGEPSDAIRDRFFEKYVTNGKRGGTGLGTYSARLFTQALGGEVELDMSRPGFTSVVVCLRRA